MHLFIRCIVAFSDEMKKIASSWWPDMVDKIKVITQSVQTFPNSSFNLRSLLSLKGFFFLSFFLSFSFSFSFSFLFFFFLIIKLFNFLLYYNNLEDNDIIISLPSGLRQVKNPGYLIDSFASWRKTNPNIYFVIIGPKVTDLIY